MAARLTPPPQVGPMREALILQLPNLLALMGSLLLKVSLVSAAVALVSLPTVMPRVMREL